MRYARHRRTGLVHRLPIESPVDKVDELSPTETAKWLIKRPDALCHSCFSDGIPREIRTLIASIQRHPSTLVPGHAA